MNTATTSKPKKQPVPGRAWALAGFVLGSLVSVGGNLQAAWLPADKPGTPADWAPSIPSQVFAVVWPLALLVSVEVLSRISWPNGAGWKLVRVGGILLVAVGSAVISYGHIYAVLTAWGYEKHQAIVGPLVIDGLMLISGFALVALGRASRAVLDASQDVVHALLAAPSRTPDAPHRPDPSVGEEHAVPVTSPIPDNVTGTAPQETSSPLPKEASPEPPEDGRGGLRLVPPRRVRRPSRKASRANAPSNEEVLAAITSYAKNNDGTLPSPNWLKTNLPISWGRAKDLLEEYANNKQEALA